MLVINVKKKEEKVAYVIVFSDFDQILHCGLQFIASHGRNHHSVELSCKFPHVLLICVHQTLGKKQNPF